MQRPVILRPARGRPAGVANAAAGARWAAGRGARLLTGFMVWLLIGYLTVPPQYWRGQTDLLAGEETNPVARAIKLALLSVSTLIVLWRLRYLLPMLRLINPFFLAFLALVPASALWSFSPGSTMARYVSLLSMVQVCFALSLYGWHRTRFQSVVRPIVTLLLIASLIFGLMYPDLAIEVGEGTLKDSWRGNTNQKNQFGMLASFGVVFWLHAWFSKEVRWWFAVPGAALGWTCVVLSRSSTSLLATTLSTVFMILVMVTPQNLRRYMPFMVSAFAVLVVVYALAVLNLIPGIGILLEPIAALSGKDLTFSNRALIWQIVKEHIQFSPMMGTGYGAYWIGDTPASPSYTFVQRMFFWPSQSHNGYLEIVNDLGFVGLTVLLGYLIFWVRHSLDVMRFDRNQGMLFLALFFQQAITNLSESTWLAINSAFAIAIVTLGTFAIARARLDQRMLVHAARRRAARR